MHTDRVVEHSYFKELQCELVSFIILSPVIFLTYKYLSEYWSNKSYIDMLLFLIIVGAFFGTFVSMLFDKITGQKELIKFSEHGFTRVYRETYFNVEEKDYFFKNIVATNIKYASLFCLEKIEIEFDNSLKFTVKASDYDTTEYRWVKEKVQEYA